MLLKLACSWEPPGSCYSTDSDSAGLGRGLRFCSSHLNPTVGNIANLGITLGVATAYVERVLGVDLIKRCSEGGLAAQ